MLRNKQRSFDLPLAKVACIALLEEVDQVVDARLKASSHVETGLLLHAVKIPSMGTQLDPETLRMAVALRVNNTPVVEVDISTSWVGMVPDMKP